MTDSYRHKGLRKKLAEYLQTKGINDPAVLAAIQAIPRHFFLDKAFEEQAYEDKAFPINANQTISQPYTVAYMTQLLKLQPKQNVLEIGTGSGYQAAILAYMGARVFTIERHQILAETAIQTFQKLDLQGIRTYYRDGFKGLPELAPFHRIIVTAAPASIPQTLCNQLADGGILVIPIGTPDNQTMTVVTRTANTFNTTTHGNFRFVPFLSGTVHKP